jgi:hypothetical protein
MPLAFTEFGDKLQNTAWFVGVVQEMGRIGPLKFYIPKDIGFKHAGF